MEPKIKGVLENEEGSGLIVSLMVLVVLSVLGAALGLVTVGSFRLGHINKDSTSAYYIAEAGANMAYEEMKNIVKESYKDSETSGAFFTEMDKPLNDKEILKSAKTYSKGYFGVQMGEIPEANVKVIGGNTIDVEGTEGKEKVKSYVIESIGKVDGRTRTVEREVEVKWVNKRSMVRPELPDGAAVIFNESIKFNGGKIHGNLYYVDSDNPPKIAKTDYFGDPIPLSKNSWRSYIDILNKLVVPPTNYENKIFNKNMSPLKIDKNTYFPQIDLANEDTLIIDTQNKEVNLIVDNFTLGNESSIELVGNGTVNLYVKKDIKFVGNTHSINSLGEVGQFNIYHSSETTIDLNTLVYKGSFYSKTKNIDLKESQTVGILFFPNAEVNLGNGGKLEGSVIANKIILKNNSNITFKKISDEYSNDADSDFDMNELINSDPAIEAD